MPSGMKIRRAANSGSGCNSYRNLARYGDHINRLI